MPSNPLTVFQQTYAQALAAGLSTTVATAAAQAAMAGVLAQQNTRRSTVATPMNIITNDRLEDNGPTTPKKKS